MAQKRDPAKKSKKRNLHGAKPSVPQQAAVSAAPAEPRQTDSTEMPGNTYPDISAEASIRSLLADVTGEAAPAPEEAEASGGVAVAVAQPEAADHEAAAAPVEPAPEAAAPVPDAMPADKYAVDADADAAAPAEASAPAQPAAAEAVMPADAAAEASQSETKPAVAAPVQPAQPAAVKESFVAGLAAKLAARRKAHAEKAPRTAKAVKPAKNGEAAHFHSLTSLLGRAVAAGILLTAMIVLAVTLLISSSAGYQVATDAAETSYTILESSYNEEGSTLQKSCEKLADTVYVSNALKVSDTGVTDSSWSSFCSMSGYFNAVLFDANGKIIASSNSMMPTGTDLSADASVRKALDNVASSYQAVDLDGTFVLEAIAPVKSGINACGGVLLSWSFESLDMVAPLQTMTGNQFTIFDGDTRAATTLTDETGAAMVGTKMGQEAADAVLTRGEAYQARTKIAGVDYIAIYHPMVSQDGVVVGALFTGYDLTSYNQHLQRGIFVSVLLALLIAVAETIGFMAFMHRRLNKPLTAIVNAVDQLGKGEVEETETGLDAVRSDDELGQLAHSTRRALRSIRQIMHDTAYLRQALASNDLTASIDGSDYKGAYRNIAEVLNQLFAEMVLNMKQIHGVAQGIADRTSQVSAAAESLAQGATEQASAVDTLANTVDQIILRVNRNAADAQLASEVSQSASEEVSSSSEQMTQMIAAMNEISRTSEQIGTVVKTIDDLAFQTSILSLNAAVEAAHAGSQGRGFAVVAGEVKNLAGKSADAAKNSAELIENVQKAIRKGVQNADAVEHSLHSMIDSTGNVNEAVLKISSAASEQAEMLQQISTGIEQISAVVQSNTGIAEETAATSQGLTLDTGNLNGMVSKYKFH